MKKFVYWTILGLLFAVTIFVRFYKLGSLPVSLYWDEAAILADARSLSATGQDIHGNTWFQAIFPSYGDYKLPVLIWLASSSVSIFGASNFAIRLCSAVAGIGTVVVAVFIARELAQLLFSTQRYNSIRSYLTVATTLVLGTSFWSILFSRTAFEGHIGQMFVGLSVYVALRASKKQWLYILSALLGALAVYTYYSIRFVWPVVFLAAAALPYLVQVGTIRQAVSSLKRHIRTIAIWLLYIVGSFAVFLLLLQPMFKSPHYLASQQYRLSAASILQREPQILEANKLRELAGNTMLDRIFFHRDLLFLKQLFIHYSEHLSVDYLFITGETNLRHSTNAHGLFAFVLIIPFLLGLYILAREKISVLLFFLLWWMISLLPASVPFDIPHALRSINALIPISLIISFGLLPLLKPTTKIRKIMSLCFFIALVLQLFQFWHYYTVIYPAASSYAWQGGYSEIARAVSEKNQEYVEVWVSVPDTKIFIWFLAEPLYSIAQIQGFEKKDFQIKQLENIHFAAYDFTTVKNPSHSVLVVNEAALLEADIARLELQPQEIVYVTDPTGTQKYMLAGFKALQ